MPRIALIGAGSAVFTRALCNDILLTPSLQDSTIVLMDIDPVRLEQARLLVQALINRRGLKAQVLATTDRKQALTGVKYVITTFQQGGLDAVEHYARPHRTVSPDNLRAGVFQLSLKHLLHFKLAPFGQALMCKHRCGAVS